MTMPCGQPRLWLSEPEFVRREEVEEGTGDGVLDLEEKVAEGLELVENVPVALHAQEGRRSPRTPDISKMRQKIATGLRVQRQSLISRRFDAFKAWAVRTAPLHGDIDGARRGGEHRHAHVGGPRALGQASPAPSEATTCNARTPRSFRAACRST